MSLRAQSQSNFIPAGRKRSRLIEGRIKQLFAGNGDIVFLFPVSLDPANLRRCELRGEERRGKAIRRPRLHWDSVRPRNSVEGIPIAALVISLRGAKARSGTRRTEWENSNELRGECWNSRFVLRRKGDFRYGSRAEAGGRHFAPRLCGRDADETYIATGWEYGKFAK